MTKSRLASCLPLVLSLACNMESARLPRQTPEPEGPSSTTPLAFHILSATPGAASATVTWEAASGATSYVLKRGSAPGAHNTVVANDATSPFLDEGLVPGATYYYLVTAVGPGGSTDAQSEISTTIPALPTAFQFTSAASGVQGAVLSWSAATGATSYVLKRGTASGVYDTTVSTDATSPYADTGLVAGQTYYYMVTALGAGGSIDAQLEIAVVAAGEPVAGDNGRIQVSPIFARTLTLHWAEASDPATRREDMEYLVYRSTSDNIGTVAAAEGNGTPVGDYTKGTTSLRVTGLEPATPYFFNVVARNIAGSKTSYVAEPVATSELTWTSLGVASPDVVPVRGVIAVGADERPIVLSQGSGCQGGPIAVAKWVGGQTWTSYGTVTARARAAAMAIDPADGKPVIAYCDTVAFPAVAVVKKWQQGTTWTDWGTGLPTDSCVIAALTIDAHSVATVALTLPDDSYRPHLYRRVDGSWSPAGVMSDTTYSVTLATGPDNRPVLAYDTPDPALRVFKWSGGTSWDDLGTPLAASTPSLIVGADNRPMIVGNDPGGTVKQWSEGTTWNSLGDGVHSGSAIGTFIAPDLTASRPFLLYASTAEGAVVQPYLDQTNGTAFTAVPPTPISTHAASSVFALQTTPIGDPVVYYRDATDNVAKVMLNR